ncbi:hypothetical protein AB0892_00880 [Streptomyces sp. NPDC005409]|uniref:hypothetical protein n=1 Tax=Streptomyces sp. NPDC005409 TaxID=3155342 RepID=UPI0034564EC6
MKPAKRISALCAVAAAGVLLSGTAAHADGDGGLLGLGLLNTPSITLACFPAGQVGAGNSFTGNQNVNCSQSASATGTTPPPSDSGLTGYEQVFASDTAGPGEEAVAVAQCPAGKTATGGGWSEQQGSSDSWEIIADQPWLSVPGDRSGWAAIARNTGTGPQTFFVFAVCYNGTPAS